MNTNIITPDRKKSTVKFTRKLEVIHPCAAGLDLHKEKIWACAYTGQASTSPVKTFNTYTRDIKALGHWLIENGVKTVAMEATGVYWVPSYNILSEMGLIAVLVNARDVKGVKGRPKTDKLDCMWICRLHAYGLLRGSYIPPANISALKSLYICRERTQQNSSRIIQRMGNELQKMNCRLDVAVDNIVGESGRKIIEAILNGERNAEKLASLAHPGVAKVFSEIALNLDGDFRKENLFILNEWFTQYNFCEERIKHINDKIYQLLELLPKKANRKDLPGKAPNYREDKMLFEQPLRPLFFEIFGTDLTQLTSVGPGVILSFLAMVGTDVSTWPTEKHFVSWLGLAPTPQISADHRKKGKTKRVKNVLTGSLKVAAMSTQRTDSFLGAFHRRIKIRVGPSKAKSASARKIAIILYRLVREGTEAIKFSAEEYETIYKERKLKNLKRQARKLGYELQEA